MSKISGFMILTALLAIQPLQSQSAPVDVDGDGKVGPHEAIDLAQNWKGPASPTGGAQPWQINGTNVFYNGGNVGIGTSAPTSKLEIAAQDGLRIRGFQPFLTLSDSNSSFARGVIQSANGNLLFYPNSAIGGAPTMSVFSAAGNVGIGTVTPIATTKLNVLTNVVGNQAIRGDAFNGNGVVGTSGRPGHGATAGVNSGHDGIGVYGEANDGFIARGVWGRADQGTGVYGTSNSAQGTESAGVFGLNTASEGVGVLGETRASNGTGVRGMGSTGIEAISTSVSGRALYVHGPGFSRIEGNVDMAGQLNLNGTVQKDNSPDVVRIDHPLDPANKYLFQTFIESSEMKNVYDGNVLADDEGNAEVYLPEYVEVLNTDFRYQLTPIGGPGADLHISQEIVDGRFRIGGGSPGLKVSWQVTGIRNDAYAKANPLEVEKIKPVQEQGKYLAPELFGQPKEKGIHYRPEMNQSQHAAWKSE